MPRDQSISPADTLVPGFRGIALPSRHRNQDWSISNDVEGVTHMLKRDIESDIENLDDEGWQMANSKGRILKLRRLGEGRNGSVTCCVLEGGKTLFAVKSITNSYKHTKSKWMLRELALSRHCNSENICRCYGLFKDDIDGTIGMSLEYCEGGSLASIHDEIQKKGEFIGEDILGKIAEGVLQGLAYLDHQHVIHRDIKPDNILFTRQGVVKLCDFGVSGQTDVRGLADSFAGTLCYMAPERITGSAYTITADVWSLGVTLFEVAQHRFPFLPNDSLEQEHSGFFDLLTCIVGQEALEIQDEPSIGVQWSFDFRSFSYEAVGLSPYPGTHFIASMDDSYRAALGQHGTIFGYHTGMGMKDVPVDAM
ncbi:MAP kinase [Hortaea werneckii]|nr:MAP kinase [Hortaea werneckii]KAI7493612.1 MAP kinase [Hortaea werneckii]